MFRYNVVRIILIHCNQLHITCTIL